MCDYCNGSKRLLSTMQHFSLKGDFYPGITITVEMGKLYVAAIADVYEPNFMEEEIDINYCPVCGADMRKEAHNEC